MNARVILTPCLPKRRCLICEGRLSEVFGSADHTNKYLHQASEAGRKCVTSIDYGTVEEAVAMAIRAAGFANLALNGNEVRPDTHGLDEAMAQEMRR